MTKQQEGNARRSRAAAVSYTSSTSTLWEWKRVMVRRAPAAGQHSAPKALRWHKLPKWPRREWLTIRVKYRGGPEGWVELEARGSKGRFEGSTALLDALNEVWGHDHDAPYGETPF